MASILIEGIYNNNDSGLVYVGKWGTFVKNGFTMVYSSTKGNYVEFLFNGTGFKWYTQTNAWRGLAKVYVDNEEKSIVDTYSATETMEVIGYEIDNLSNTTHTVKVEVLAQGNSKAIEYKVVIDKIEILQEDKTLEYKKELEEKQATLTEKERLLQENLNKQQELNNDISIMEKQISYLKNPNGRAFIKGRYKNDDSNLKYIGTWGTFYKNGLKMIFSATKGDNIEFTFLGTGFKWYTQTNAWRGIAKVYIDSVEIITIDTYSATETMNVVGYSRDSLKLSEHNVKIEVLAQGNIKAIEYKVVIDSIEILQNITTEEYENQFTDKKSKLNVLISEEQKLEEEIATLQSEIDYFKKLILGAIEEPVVIPVTNIIFETTEVILNEGESYQLKWSIEPENATDKSIKFESGNTGFVVVSDSGLLTYVYEGETNISGITSNNIIKYVKVICKGNEVINPPVTDNDKIVFVNDEENIDISNAIESKNLVNEGILIANEGEELEVGEKVKIIAHILPYNVMGTNQYIIKSSDENVIKVNKGRVIEASSKGQAIVTVYSLDGKYKDSVQYTVKDKEESAFLTSEIYTLDINRFNIIVNNNTEAVAINNSKGINAALKFCSRYWYKKIVFPKNALIYIEPKITIYMVSNVWVDLNGSELKLRANNYERYGAINFKEGNINLLHSFDISDKTVGTFLNTKDVIKTTVKENKVFYSNAILVRSEKTKEEYNQDLNYVVYGDNLQVSIQIARNIITVDTSKTSTVNGNIYVEYYKDNILIATEKLQQLWLSSGTGAYFSNNNVSFKVRSINDYNSMKVKIEWLLNNATAEIYIGEVSLVKKVTSVLNNAKLFNGIVTGERDEKASLYSNWYNVSSTEGGCSILFNEGYKNGIENLIVRKSIGFNISSGLGNNSYGVVNYSSYPISYRFMELGSLDSSGQLLDSSDLIRTIDYIDISRITTPYYEIGYPLGYMGYPYVTCRIYDVCFYDVNKNFIRKDRGRLRFRRYSKPENSYYAKFVFYSNTVPTSGNTDFNGAFAFIQNFEYPIKNFIRDCTIEDNYSCGFAACGGQKWRIENNTWRRNAGRMPGCDIDWEDGWEYMQDDLVEGNSFESYNNVILCAGAGQIYKENKFNGITTVYGRSQYWSFINNIINDTVDITSGNGAKLSLSSSTDIYIEGNNYKDSSLVWSPNHGTNAVYDAYIKNEVFDNSNILNGGVKNIKECSFTGSNFSIYSLRIYNCNIESGMVTTNATLDYCNIKSIILRPTKDSSVKINNSYLLDVSIEVMSQANDIIIDKCIISRDKVGGLIAPSSSGTGGLVVTNSTLKFNTISDYHYIIGGWNATGCTATYTFTDCKIETQTGFKGYLIKCSWYASSTDTKHVTLNFNNTDVSMFESTDAKGLNSNIIFNIN